MALNIPWDLFKKYFLESITENELLLLEQWHESSELNDTIYHEILDDKRIQDVLLSGKWEDHVQEWQELLAIIKPPARQITFTRHKFYIALTAAASIMLLLGITFGYQYNRISSDKMSVPESYNLIYSPRGQRTRVILPDNSLVWLNGESSIKYATTYNQNKREVYLSGEAFFEVEKNPDKPFYVNADEVKIKVYGTSFNVKAFPDENIIETTLIEGKLSIIPMNNKEKPGEEIYLKPNEKCLVKKDTDEISTSQSLSDGDKGSESIQKGAKDQNTRIVIESNINPDREKLWKDGKLIFRNETYGDLAVKLERWYDVKIHFEDEGIKNFVFTGSFEKETINQAMEALRVSSQKSYQYEIIFRDIYLTSK